MLKKNVAKLEKAQTMSDQYSQRNNIKLAGIPNSIRGNDLEKNINVFKEHGVDITPMDIEYAAGFLLVMPNLPKTLTNVRELS